MTNYGDVFLLAYFGTKEDGAWQRPARFNHGEKDDLIKKIMARIANGEGVREMAREYHIPKSTVSRWVGG
jgi:DNA invertase Pin-like site-specific DNA recombinase